MTSSRFETLIASIVQHEGHCCTELRKIDGQLHKRLGPTEEQPRFGKQQYIVINQVTYGLSWKFNPQTPTIS